MPLSRDAIPTVLQQAVGLHQTGQAQTAFDIYQAILELAPERADVWYLSGVAACQFSRFDLALAAAERALQLPDPQAAYFLTLGHALQGLGRPAEAVNSFRDALRLRQAYPEALHGLGIALQDLGRAQEAEACFRSALEFNPRDSRACFNLAVVQQQLGEYADAIGRYRQAVTLRPDYAEAWCRLGVLLRTQNRLGEAADCLQQAVRCRPKYFDAGFNLAITLESLCRLPEAIAAYREALLLRPDSADACNNLGNALTNHCRLDDAAAAYRRALQLRPGDAQIHSNLLVCLNYNPACNNDEIFAEHLAWARQHAPLPAEVRSVHANTRDPHRRLRIGYVSPSFGAGAVKYFLQPLLTNHCSTEVETYAYATLDLPEEITRETREAVAHWRAAGRLDAAALAEQVRADAIDILVDLSGHTPGHRLLSFARKPAPVQVSWLDYFNTSGLPAMDYLVTDAIHTPPETTRQFTETLALLPHCRLCYAPPAYAPEVGAAPFLKNGYPTFGCFNRLSKLTPEGIDLWCKLLHALPQARLVLKSHSLSDPASWPEYHGWFERHGIDAQRIELRAASAHPLMLAEYGDIDIALDPFPYNGGLTTCEALWMGVPVVALAGERMIARQSAALLTAAGLESFIAQSPDDYIGIAQEWASAPDRLAQLRQSLRRRVADSPLCDGKKFARNMEGLYRDMWRRWCADH